MNEFDQERIDYAKFHRTAEKQLLPLFRKALATSVQPIIDWVNQYGVDGVPYEILLKTDVWRSTYQNAFNLIGMKSARKEFYRQRTLDGQAQEKASAIEFLVDIWTGILRDYALTYTYQIERELNDRTRSIIEQALGETGVLEIDREGRLRFFLTKIKDVLQKRSLTISRTEATRTSNLGKEIGARSWINQSGEEGYKVWLGRVTGERPTHLAVNDTIIGIDDYFTVGGEQALRPGDISLSADEVINCRCTQSIMSSIRYNAYVKQGRIVNGKLVGAS